ncbi:transcription antitermination protein NusB [Lachnospiraceae bacterium]|nr:transcription antitermination factor NusB [Lachnospiraceae bacterium]GFI31686.1 transcription antitermination protein NusB [Lachnospiraceae bacterium]
MSRREVREQIFKLLFRAEFYEEAELPEQLELFFEELDQKEEKDARYIQGKFEQIVSRLPELDGMINEAAKGWKTTRMGKVDLTLIRLAVYEIKFEEEVPTGVAINEAVELAKNYGTDDSASFVNGILAKLA